MAWKGKGLLRQWRTEFNIRTIFSIHSYGLFGELAAAETGAQAYFQWEFEQAERSYSAFRPHISLEGKEVLDVGCGLGGKELFYLQKGARSVTGLDISQTNVRITQACFAGGRTAPPSSLPEFARIDLAGAVELPHVNKLTVGRFERLLKASSLEVVSKRNRPVGTDMVKILRPVLSLAAKIPLLREAFTSSVVLVGRKPD